MNLKMTKPMPRTIKFEIKVKVFRKLFSLSYIKKGILSDAGNR